MAFACDDSFCNTGTKKLYGLYMRRVPWSPTAQTAQVMSDCANKRYDVEYGLIGGHS